MPNTEPQTIASTPIEPVPGYVDNQMSRWYIPDGVVVADKTGNLPGIYLYTTTENNPRLTNPQALIDALIAAERTYAQTLDARKEPT